MAMNRIHQDRLTTEVDWLGGKLEPLRCGQSVAFMMYTTKATGKRKNPLIVITPGTQLNFSRKAVVVSVINNGSCIVEIGCRSTTGLILAGIPAKLAKVLVDRLQLTFREEEPHGNHTTPKRRARYTERATRWKSTRKSTVTTVPT